MAEFNRVGYDLQLPWQVLDAAHHGVPQHRERLVADIMGQLNFRNGIAPNKVRESIRARKISGLSNKGSLDCAAELYPHNSWMRE